jgi:hypothetical protein
MPIQWLFSHWLLIVPIISCLMTDGFNEPKFLTLKTTKLRLQRWSKHISQPANGFEPNIPG